MGYIELKQVTKNFGDLQVIKPLDLEIKDGEFTVFVGPSGCGKSTLLRLIAGLEDLTSGSIQIDGREASQDAPAKRGLAMVFQSYALYPHMNVYKNIAFPLKMVGMDKDAIDEKVRKAAEVLNLNDYLERKPSAFLFDEPLSNLDAALRVGMRLEISELHKRLNTTMIYVTHDQVEAMTMADQIVVMNHGVIEQVGTPLELYRNPKNLFVAGFIGSPKMNFIEGSWAQAQGAHTVGIRPEHISITSQQSEWKGVVKMAENLGSDTFLHIQDSGIAETLTVRADGEKSFNRGQEVFLQPKKESLHLFNEKGERQ